MILRGKSIIILLLAGLAAASAREPEFNEFRAVQESLSGVHPRMRASWLAERGLDDSYYTTFRKPDSSGIRMVGKWGRGPSVEVTGQDSLVALTLGSEVALLNFADPDSPEVLAEIQLSYLPSQSALQDSLLFIGGNGIETWNIEDPTQPERLSIIPYAVGDFSLQDTFLYFVSLDTFRVYSIADPENPYQLGSCRDSGYVAAAAGSTVVLMVGEALGFIDVSDPANPHRVGQYPGFALGTAARGNICCAAMYWSTDEDHFRFEVLDISNPGSVSRLGYLNDIGGYDVHLDGPLAFVSGFQSSGFEFTIISIADSTNPSRVGGCTTPGDNSGVWSRLAMDRAFVADRSQGLTIVDISNLNNPSVDTSLMKASRAQDIWIDGDYAYVADCAAGLRILDVSDPPAPAEIGGLDSMHYWTSETVTARDSFAFEGLGWPPYFRSILVSDPTRPVVVGGGASETVPKDMVLRDTLIYLAGRLRFHVINVARPREPELVGSCVLSGDVWDMDMEGNLAYVTSRYFTTVDVSRPDSPQVIHEWGSRASGVDIVDTIAYLAYYGLKTASVANPTSPYILDSVPLNDIISDVVVVDTLAFVGGYTLHIFNVADPRNIRQVGSWTAPHWVRRLLYAPPYLYAACYAAGVCILETTQTSIEEPLSRRPGVIAVRVWPSVTMRWVHVEVAAPASPLELELFDAMGSKVPDAAWSSIVSLGDCFRMELDLAGVPAGVYVLRSRVEGKTWTTKVVRTRRR